MHYQKAIHCIPLCLQANIFIHFSYSAYKHLQINKKKQIDELTQVKQFEMLPLVLDPWQ